LTSYELCDRTISQLSRFLLQQTVTISNENVGKQEEFTLSKYDDTLGIRSIYEVLAKSPSNGSIGKQLLLEPISKDVSMPTKGISKPVRPKRRKKIVALDCEMVGVGPMKISVLARVSIVNYQGKCFFDSFVKVDEPVTDYRTEFSGIRREDLESEHALPFGVVRARVKKILHRAILVGHGLENDLAVLHLNKSHSLIRDTSRYVPFMAQSMDGMLRARRLRDLLWEHCGVVIQNGEHNSIEDAWAAMVLFRRVEKEWDKWRRSRYYVPFDHWTPNMMMHSSQRQLRAKATAWMP
jgi:Exonuclease